MQFSERPEDIIKQDFDQDVFKLCDIWDAYTAKNAPNQIDSGLWEEPRTEVVCEYIVDTVVSEWGY